MIKIATVSGTISIFDRMSKPLMQMTNALNITISALDDLASSANSDINIGNSINAARSELSQAAASFKEACENADKLASSQNKVNDSFNKAPPSVSRFQRALDYAKGSLLAYVGMQGVRAVINLGKAFITTADSVTQTKARLDLMNDGLQTTAELQDMIAQSAKNARGNAIATADAVSKLGITASGAFNGTAEVVDFMEQINKQFKIAGTNAEGQSAAMLQLTQAMGSGVLRGEELNSIFEQAPTIIQSIAKHLDVPIGRIREMASEGKITAQIVKEAMFATADETNAKFESIPKTFGDMITDIKNSFISTLEPMFNSFSDWLNSDIGQDFFNNIKTGLSTLVAVGGTLIGIVTALTPIFNTIFSVISDNISYFIELFKSIAPIIMPVLWGIIGGLALYAAWLGIIKGLELASIAVMAIKTAYMYVGAFAYNLLTGSISFSTIAQTLFNAALSMCPIFWIIAGIALFIIILYKMGVTAEMVVGSVVGVFYALGAHIYNVFATAWNIVASFVEFFANVWNNPLYSIKKLFANIWNGIVDLVSKSIGWIIDLINKIPGINIDSSLSGFKADPGKAPDNYWEAPKMGLKDVGQAFDNGYNTGSNFVVGIKDKIGGLFNGDNSDQDNGYDVGANNSLNGIDSLNNAANKGNDTLSSINDKIDISNENLEIMRDLAEQESIQNFVTLTPTVQVTTGDIKETADIKQIIGQIEDYMTTELVNSAEGVYS